MGAWSSRGIEFRLPPSSSSIGGTDGFEDEKEDNDEDEGDHPSRVTGRCTLHAQSTRRGDSKIGCWVLDVERWVFYSSLFHVR